MNKPIFYEVDSVNKYKKENGQLSNEDSISQIVILILFVIVILLFIFLTINFFN
jgi:hypothetical protein